MIPNSYQNNDPIYTGNESIVQILIPITVLMLQLLSEEVCNMDKN